MGKRSTPDVYLRVLFQLRAVCNHSLGFSSPNTFFFLLGCILTVLLGFFNCSPEFTSANTSFFLLGCIFSPPGLYNVLLGSSHPTHSFFSLGCILPNDSHSNSRVLNSLACPRFEQPRVHKPGRIRLVHAAYHKPRIMRMIHCTIMSKCMCMFTRVHAYVP